MAAATGHDSWGKLDLEDFANLAAKLPEKYTDGSDSFICSRSFYAQGVLRAAGDFAQGFALDGTPLFMGKKVHLLPAMPSTSAASTLSCLYGNWRESVIFGDRGLKYALSNKCPDCIRARLDRYPVFLTVRTYHPQCRHGNRGGQLCRLGHHLLELSAGNSLLACSRGRLVVRLRELLSRSGWNHVRRRHQKSPRRARLRVHRAARIIGWWNDRLRLGRRRGWDERLQERRVEFKIHKRYKGPRAVNVRAAR